MALLIPHPGRRPTAGTLFFPEDVVPLPVVAAIQHGETMETLRRGLRAHGDPMMAEAVAEGIVEALRRLLDVPLIHVLVAAWREHPELSAPARAHGQDPRTTLVPLGEHEIVSRHRPRVDVLVGERAVGVLQFDLRIELAVQDAVLHVDDGARLAHVTLGACRGSGVLGLDDREIARFDEDDVGLPEQLALDEPWS